MSDDGSRKHLTLDAAVGLLQRHLPEKNARAWLEIDRKMNPLIPFSQIGDTILYLEDDLLHFIRQVTKRPLVRNGHERRSPHERRVIADRRHKKSRREPVTEAGRDNIDRRFAPRKDRRSEINRRLRALIDRRDEERRGHKEEKKTPGESE